MKKTVWIRMPELSLILMLMLFFRPLPGRSLPDTHNEPNKTISYADMERLLQKAAKPGLIDVETIGKSSAGRNLYLVHINRRPHESQTRVFLYAQQHGNEVSGKDALLGLIAQVAMDPQHIPLEVDLWLLPMFNPDGAEADQRENGAGADLNRDHQRLAQPETRAFYAAVQRIMPHLAIDMHEFNRSSESYSRRGWRKWPDITMDTTMHPFFNPRLAAIGLSWIKSAVDPLRRAGFRFARYSVGGPPPESEIRPSTLEFDDARSGVASYGALSFIVECAVERESGAAEAAATPRTHRVKAYLALIDRFLNDRGLRAAVRPLVEHWRQNQPLPGFLPVNCFWGNAGLKVEAVRVLAAGSDRDIVVPSANVMHDVVVKICVARPQAYAIPGRFRELFEPLLRAHAIRYEILEKPRPAQLEAYRLLRIETEYDNLYERYEGRQIVVPAGREAAELTAGTLLVPTAQPGALRAFMHLEPAMLYGLYIFPEFAKTVTDGLLPVSRVVE